MTTAATAEATKTRTATEIPPRFDRLAPALCKQLGPGLADLVEIRLDDAQLIGFNRFLGLRHAAGRGRASTARTLALLFLDLCYGPAIVNICDLARRAALSRPSVYKAIAFVAEPEHGQPKLIRLDQRPTGPRRPGRWEIRRDILENSISQRTQEKAASAASVNSKDSIEANFKTTSPETGHEALTSSPLLGAARPPLGILSNIEADPKSLLAWMDSPSVDLNRTPTFSERRKMAAALRLAEDVNCDVANAVLDGLFWRCSAPLRVWKTAILALIDAGDRFTRPAPPRHFGAGIVQIGWQAPPEHWSRQSSTELAWRARLGLKILCADPDAAAAFLTAMELGTLPEDSAPDAVQEHVKRIEAQVRDIYAAAAVRGTCPLCGKLVKLGPLPTVDEAKRIDGTFAFQVLRTIPEWRETAPGEKRKRTQFVRDNYRTLAQFGPHVFTERTGPHLCAVTLITKRYFLKQKLKGVRC